MTKANKHTETRSILRSDFGGRFEKPAVVQRGFLACRDTWSKIRPYKESERIIDRI